MATYSGYLNGVYYNSEWTNLDNANGNVSTTYGHTEQAVTPNNAAILRFDIDGLPDAHEITRVQVFWGCGLKSSNSQTVYIGQVYFGDPYTESSLLSAQCPYNVVGYNNRLLGTRTYNRHQGIKTEVAKDKGFFLRVEESGSIGFCRLYLARIVITYEPLDFIYLGSSSIKSIKLGTSDIVAVYKGDTKII